MISKSELIFSRFVVKVIVLVSSWWLHSIRHFTVEKREEVNGWIVQDFLKFVVMEIFLEVVKHIMHA